MHFEQSHSSSLESCSHSGSIPAAPPYSRAHQALHASHALTFILYPPVARLETRVQVNTSLQPAQANIVLKLTASLENRRKCPRPQSTSALNCGTGARPLADPLLFTIDCNLWRCCLRHGDVSARVEFGVRLCKKLCVFFSFFPVSVLTQFRVSFAVSYKPFSASAFFRCSFMRKRAEIENDYARSIASLVKVCSHRITSHL